MDFGSVGVRVSPFLLAAFGTVLTAGPVLGCACCAAAHTYSVVQKKWNGPFQRLIAGIRHVDGTLAERGPDPRHDDIRTTGLSVGSVAVTIQVPGGSMSLDHGGRYFARQTDVTDFVKAGDPGVKLLKEYIFRGRIGFAGVLAKRYGAQPARGFVVLKAIGNACASRNGFRSWSIRFKAGRATIAGGGRMAGR